MNYLLQVLIIMGIYSILALSLNLLVGYTGILSLCHAAFYGIGAYTTALLMVKAGMGFLPSMLLAIVLTIALSFTISLPSLRLRGDYFVLASLGFQTIVFAILYNWVDVTNGPFGISGIPRPRILALEIQTVPEYFAFVLVIALACTGLLYLIGNSPYGRVLKAIREDEVATAALGKNIFLFKVVAFAIAAGFAAIAGALFAGYLRYIDPTSFTLTESVFILSIIIIGGAGNISGPLLGAAFLVALPEILRFAQVPDEVAANARQIIYGALIILLMRYRPRGLRGEYRFE